MLERTRHLRLVLVAVSGLAAGLFPIIGPWGPRTAWADDDEDEEDSGDDEEGDDEEGGGEDEDEEVDEDQPPITAGGLYTIKTYPQGEIQRPLTMTEGITELKLGLGFDISNATAFETVGVSGDARYGYKDNVELRAGFAGIKNFDIWNAYAAFEGSIIYDLVDFRVGANIAHGGDETKFNVPIGVPFRYAPKEQVAVTAFETMFSINFDAKPDFTPNVGIVIQPQPIVAILLKASLIIPRFDFRKDNVVVPASAAVQLSPNNRLDAGMEFRFGNLKLPEGTDIDGDGEEDKFYDDRFLLFFARYRL
jgi:hypothetical protein